MKKKTKVIYHESSESERSMTVKDMKLVRSVAYYARELPLCDTDAGRLIAMYKAVERLRKVIWPLLDVPKGNGKLNPWFKESVIDAMNELVAHLEIAGALKESIEFACLNHKKKQEHLIDFIKDISKSDSVSVGTREMAKIKLKQWGL